MNDDKEDAAPPAPEDAPPPMEEIFSGPAVHSNKVYVTLVPPFGVRLTFMEITPGPDGAERFRTAAYLSVLDASALQEVMQSQLGKLNVMFEAVEIKPEGEATEPPAQEV